MSLSSSGVVKRAGFAGGRAGMSRFGRRAAGTIHT